MRRKGYRPIDLGPDRPSWPGLMDRRCTLVFTNRCFFLCTLSFSFANDSSRAWVKSKSRWHWRRYVGRQIPRQKNTENKRRARDGNFLGLFIFVQQFYWINFPSLLFSPHSYMQVMTSTGNAKVKPPKRNQHTHTHTGAHHLNELMLFVLPRLPPPSLSLCRVAIALTVFRSNFFFAAQNSFLRRIFIWHNFSEM